MTERMCSVDGCGAKKTSRGWCNKHYLRWRKYGDPNRVIVDRTSQRRSHSMGYQMVKRAGHPLAHPNGWAFEHRAVLFDTIGPGWHSCHHCGMQVSWELTYPEHLDALVVDHLDEDKANNDPANLVPSCQPCNFARSGRWVKRRRKEAAQ